MSLENVTKKYGAHCAVRDLTLDVRPGEIFGLIGPNGAGKTTTMRLLCGLARPTSGSAYVFGHDATSDRVPIANRVGVMIGDGGLYPSLSVQLNLDIFLRAAGLGREAESGLLDRVDLSHVARRRVRSLSTGMRQRLRLAIALLGSPDLLILDEPTVGLDPSGVRTTRDLIREVVERGGSVFLSSHHLGELELLCDRVAVVIDGRLVKCAPPREFRELDEDHVHIRVPDACRARTVLVRAGLPHAVRDSVIVLSEQRLAGVLEVLASEDIYPTEILRPTVSLEDAYLDLLEADVPDQPS